jgi:hypothetical protein
MREDEGVAPAGLAEFATLKNEIQYRSTAQLALFSLNVTAVGVIGSVALSRREAGVLLVLAVLSPALGMFYLDHDRHIRAQGTYIREVLWPIIGNGLPTWENQSMHRLQLSAVRRFYLVPLVVVFGGPPVASLVLVAIDVLLTGPMARGVVNLVQESVVFLMGITVFGLWVWSLLDSTIALWRRPHGNSERPQSHGQT